MGSQLVKLAVRGMRDGGCAEAVLETEVTNIGALRLYEGLGFVRDKRLHRYYLNGNDAYRLKVWFNRPAALDGPPLPLAEEAAVELE
jgi:N-alpha-acetyltransferase 30